MNIFTEFLANLGLNGAGNIIRAVVIFVICWAAISILSAVVNKLLDKSRKLDGALKGFIKTAMKIALWALAIIMIADSLGIDTASLVAALSVVGLALSLAVQNVAANVFSGITLLMTHPFSEGDFVDIAGKSGVVKSVGLFYTVITTGDNRVITIPNGDVTAASIINYSREDVRRVDFAFSASYDDPTEKVKAAILDAVAGDERVLPEPAPFVALSAYKDSSIEYTLRIWCKNADYWDLYFATNERVRESFERSGVQMSYAHMNVHIVKD